ncbi:hypothetical protein DYB35_013430 [Aphanomyces astaci]|uniref:TH1 domain-containing protein n=2 Tax=Aphanomyces astaci TaxID=112090 RepID=A0A418DZN5_APHAT|nr:hypothetical protein DYB35_013430 [Aphanomyces astaci]
MRRHGAADKATVAGLYSHWDQLASKVLQPTSRLRSHLAAGEVYNAASFLTSYAKRNAAVRHLNKVKKAVQVFSSRWKGRQTRRNMSPDLARKCYKAMLGIRTEFVAQTRLLLIGEMNVHNIKADKMDKPKERRVVPIAQLSKISMSSLHDNYLFLHVNNDVGLMYEVDQKTEVVLVLKQRFKELCKRDLPVTISDTIEFEAKKGMRLAFRFVKNQNTTVTTMEKLDKKNGQVNVGTKY